VSDEEDPFRYCVYCKADCYADEPEHAEDCPSTTGVYPVREGDFGPKCIHCGKGAHGPMCCAECEAELGLGDHYMHREVDPGDPDDPNPFTGAPTYEVICMGCAAKEALT
jgi:hypothetical protein